METLMKTLMVGENSRNLCHRTKRLLRALVNSTTDKPPAHGVHGCDHEGFMTLEPMLTGWFALRRGQGDKDGQNPSSRGSWL
jgi:hypothetical protein